jgi:hypothetical protein
MGCENSAASAVRRPRSEVREQHEPDLPEVRRALEAAGHERKREDEHRRQPGQGAGREEPGQREPATADGRDEHLPVGGALGVEQPERQPALRREQERGDGPRGREDRVRRLRVEHDDAGEQDDGRRDEPARAQVLGQQVARGGDHGRRARIRAGGSPRPSV